MKTLCLLFFFLPVISCVSPAKESLGRRQTLSVEEQNSKTLETLQEISRVSEGARKTMRPGIEATYIDLINKYPDSQMVYECYNRLMLIYLTEYEPPAFEKAESLRDTFARRYTDLNARNLIDDTLADAYYRNQEWTKLMRLYTSSIKRFIELWNVIRPRDMFMYAEAKFHLGDMDEARKGYNIVTFYFPNSPESSLATIRLDEIAGGSRNIQAKGESERPLNRVQVVEPPPQKVPQEPEPKVSAPAEGVVSLKAPEPEQPVPEKASVAEKPPAPGTGEKVLYSVQLGFFGNERNATSLSEKLKKKGYDAFALKHISEDNKIFFRVLSGRFHDKAEAMEYAEIFLRRENMKSIIFRQYLE
jgi:cell division septation protein DedD